MKLIEASRAKVLDIVIEKFVSDVDGLHDLCQRAPLSDIVERVATDDITKKVAKELFSECCAHPEVPKIVELYSACTGLQQSCNHVLAEFSAEIGESLDSKLAEASEKYKRMIPRCSTLAAMLALWRTLLSHENRVQVCSAAHARLEKSGVAGPILKLLEAAKLGRGTYVK